MNACQIESVMATHRSIPPSLQNRGIETVENPDPEEQSTTTANERENSSQLSTPA